MDVKLYVYDLSQGMARQFSQTFLGTHIDAVYHTAIVFDNIEYFFGAGVQTCYPGTTHHGRPMEILDLGRTELSMEVILGYLESLKQVYTMESYDLFLHNCNNFSHDFAIFLVGHGIPEHITSLPQTVMNTPFGQMLKPQLDSAMRNVTQAPVPPQNIPPPAARASKTAAAASAPPTAAEKAARMKYPALLQPSRLQPVTYAKVPPMTKILAKLGAQAREPIVNETADFIRAVNDPETPQQEASLPNLGDLGAWLTKATTILPPDSLFAAYDLVRLAITDPRIREYFATHTEGIKTTSTLLKHLGDLADNTDAAKVRLVACQLCCNITTGHFLGALTEDFIHVVANGLLTKPVSAVETNVRIVSANLAFNLAIQTHRVQERPEAGHTMPEGQQVELLASTLEALGSLADEAERKKDAAGTEAIEPLVRAFGLLLHGGPKDGEVRDLCEAMEARPLLARLPQSQVVKEVWKLLNGGS
ncbi:hypothetical protein LTS18_007758 [Coniosporium uncinatum]|uniref:Uncharacterized protein n=1 Tax=Coniosporium uncinatum TaxID=93489 RepID=A0ACC3DNS5_9PEZI|nr:hypothetical protein LTS18_007758 [Coniosporium uncinatum]